MKKVVLFVAFLGIAALAKSQNLTDVWTVKPYVGINLSSLTKFPEAQEGKLKVGLVGGADVELRAMKWLGVSLGANYSVQGNRYNKAFYTSMPEHLYDPKEDLILHPSDPSIKFLGSQSSYQISLEYVNIPLSAHFYLFEHFTLHAGVQMGFLTRAEQTYFDGKTNKNETRDITSKLECVDISIPIGASYEYRNFVIDARYSWGLSDVAQKSMAEKNDGKYILVPCDFRSNSVIRFTLGYRFAL